MGRSRRTIAVAVLLVFGALSTMSHAAAQTDTTESTDTTVPSDSTTTTLPPVMGNEPPASVPDSPDTVPPREASTGVGPASVVPPPANVVRLTTRAARAQALARQAAFDGAVAHRTELEQSLAGLQSHVAQLAATARQAVLDLADARDELRQRAVDAYVRGPDFDQSADLDDVSDEGSQRAALLTAIVDRDRAAVDRVKALQRQVSSDQAKTAAELTTTQAELEQARVDEAQALLDLNFARFDLAVTAAGGDIVIHGFVFPVASPHSFVEDFGDPRLPGTEYAHFHEGCDIVADEGTQLFAAERGVITDISASNLGGQQLWLKGESGTSYYYAHLSAYAPDLKVGQLVDAGTLVGLVGHTGDAFGPHLHFEVHPGGGPAIDPYPILVAADPDHQHSS